MKPWDMTLGGCCDEYLGSWQPRWESFGESMTRMRRSRLCAPQVTFGTCWRVLNAAKPLWDEVHERTFPVGRSWMAPATEPPVTP